MAVRLRTAAAADAIGRFLFAGPPAVGQGGVRDQRAAERDGGNSAVFDDVPHYVIRPIAADRDDGNRDLIRQRFCGRGEICLLYTSDAADE